MLRLSRFQFLLTVLQFCQKPLSLTEPLSEFGLALLQHLLSGRVLFVILLLDETEAALFGVELRKLLTEVRLAAFEFVELVPQAASNLAGFEQQFGVVATLVALMG